MERVGCDAHAWTDPEGHAAHTPPPWWLRKKNSTKVLTHDCANPCMLMCDVQRHLLSMLCMQMPYRCVMCLCEIWRIWLTVSKKTCSGKKREKQLLVYITSLDTTASIVSCFCLSLSLWLWWTIFLSIIVCLAVCLSVCVPHNRSVSLSICLSVS